MAMGLPGLSTLALKKMQKLAQTIFQVPGDGPPAKSGFILGGEEPPKPR